jgi:hypothetical protein
MQPTDAANIWSHLKLCRCGFVDPGTNVFKTSAQQSHENWRMRTGASMITALLTAGILTTPASTTIAASGQRRSHASGHHTATTVAPPARIACTVLGCEPIPAACTPVPGRTWSGLPTGYDVILCPPGVWPLR